MKHCGTHHQKLAFLNKRYQHILRMVYLMLTRIVKIVYDRGKYQKYNVARMTGLEPATSGVTGRRSNQLSYIRISLRRSESATRPAARGV